MRVNRMHHARSPPFGEWSRFQVWSQVRFATYVLGFNDLFCLAFSFLGHFNPIKSTLAQLRLTKLG